MRRMGRSSLCRQERRQGGLLDRPASEVARQACAHHAREETRRDHVFTRSD
jgi:hypothetical protein